MSMNEINTLKVLYYDLLELYDAGSPLKIKKTLDEILRFSVEIVKAEVDTQKYLRINEESYKHKLMKQSVQTCQKAKASQSVQKCKELITDYLVVLSSVEDQKENRKMIVQNYIKPIMKQWKFKKKGNNFIKQVGDYILFLIVYSSRFNDFSYVQFTLDLQVRENDKLVKQERIGRLVHGSDKWYELTPEKNPKKIGEIIQKDIQTYAKQFFAEYDKA